MQKRICLGLTSLFLAICLPGNCAEAVFSIDEQIVYLVTSKGLVELNLPTKSVRTIEPPANFSPDADSGVSLSNSGYLPFAPAGPGNVSFIGQPNLKPRK